MSRSPWRSCGSLTTRSPHWTASPTWQILLACTCPTTPSRTGRSSISWCTYSCSMWQWHGRIEQAHAPSVSRCNFSLLALFMRLIDVQLNSGKCFLLCTQPRACSCRCPDTRIFNIENKEVQGGQTVHHLVKVEKHRIQFLYLLITSALFLFLVVFRRVLFSVVRIIDAVGYADRRTVHGESDLRGDVERRRANRGAATHTPS